jgi:hypothetical protein
MVELQTPLTDAAYAIADATGVATVSFGPQRPNTYWIVETVAVSASSNTLEPNAKIYKNGVNPGTFISGTYSGSNDADDNVMQKLWPGEQITVQWTNADIGAQCTAAYRGTVYSMGRG